MQYQYLEKDYKKFLETGEFETALELLKSQISINLIELNNSLAKNKINDIIEIYNIIDFDVSDSQEMRKFMPLYRHYIGIEEVFVIDGCSVAKAIKMYQKLEQDFLKLLEEEHLK